MELNRRTRKGAQRNAFQRTQQEDIEALLTTEQKHGGKIESNNFLRNQKTYTRLLFLFLLVFALIGISCACRMSINGSWCRRTEIQIHRQCTLMKKINQILKNNNFESWLCYGSALAAYRDKGVPIPWEIDDDICILSDDLEDIEKILRSKSKELNIRVEVPDDFGVVAMKVFFKPMVSSDDALNNNNDDDHLNIIDKYPAGEYNIDFYAHKERAYWGKIKMMQNIAFVRDRYKRDMPLSVLKPFQQVNYCGPDATFNIPGNTTFYLSHLYGTKFDVPQKLVPSNGYRGWRCLLSF
jgi:hypothetical protein